MLDYRPAYRIDSKLHQHTQNVQKITCSGRDTGFGFEHALYGANDYASDIAGGLRQARHIAAFNRIEINGKHDNRNMAARAYDCLQGDLGASDNQQVGLSAHQFRRADKWTAGIVDGTIFNNDILSFAKPILFQLRRKGLVDSGEPRLRGPAREILFGGFFQLAVREH